VPNPLISLAFARSWRYDEISENNSI